MTSKTLLQQANELFRAGMYEDALSLYEAILVRDNAGLSTMIKHNIKMTINRLPETSLKYKYLISGTPRIAVCLHLYYIEHWDKIQSYLQNISEDYDLFISCPHDKISQAEEIIFPQNTVIIPVNNSGMDVLPFINVFHNYVFGHYEYVCKIHTKNDKSEIRAIQGNILFEGILGDRKLVETIIKIFDKNSLVGLAGAEYIYRCGQSLMYGNRKLFNEVLTKFNYIDMLENDFGFFAGTMFWARVDALADLSLNYDLICQLFKTYNVEVKTGIDGSIAHAMERIICILPKAKGYHLNNLVYKRSPKDGYATNIVDDKSELISNMRKMPIVPLIHQYIYASNNLDELNKCVLFDEKFYLLNNELVCKLKINPQWHYLLYANFEGLDPSLDFSTKAYLLYYSDIRNRSINPLLHYTKSGIKERRVIKFNCEMSHKVAKVYGLVDLPQNIFNYKHHELYSLTESLVVDFINYYFENYLFNEAFLFTVLKDLIHNDVNLEQAFNWITLHQHTFIPTRLSIAILAISYSRKKYWSLASDTWQKYYISSKNGLRNNMLKLPVNKNNLIGNNIFASIDNINESGNIPKNLKICVYTALFGGYDALKPILFKSKQVEFICFTDRDMVVDGWRIIKLNPKLNDNNLNAKIFKVLPYDYLRDFNYSLFVDASTVFVGNIDFLINKYLIDHDFVMWKHPERCDVEEESEVILQLLKHEPVKILHQMKSYIENGLEKSTGLVEASFIWRNHSNLQLREFMGNWWNEIITHSKRDQLSLGYLMWKLDFRPQVLPDKLGNVRKNCFFEKLPHTPANFNTANAVNNKKLVFIYCDEYQNSGSTIMRGYQLSEILKKHDNIYDSVDQISYTNSLEQNNAILFLTKGLLKIITIEQLTNLKKNGNLLLFDFVDDPVRKEIVEFADVLIAASISSYLDSCRRFSQAQNWLITHHVDPRLNEDNIVIHKTIKAGYFGELVNTVKLINHPEVVDFHLVSTAKIDNSWLEIIGNYNFHYAIRRKRGIDGNKPFTKGFIAAKMNANMIIQRSEIEATYYLTQDYPYIYDGELEPDKIIDKMKYIQDSYGSREWAFGLDIMKSVKHRSSDAFIVSEFKNLLDYLKG